MVLLDWTFRFTSLAKCFTSSYSQYMLRLNVSESELVRETVRKKKKNSEKVSRMSIRYFIVKVGSEDVRTEIVKG